MTEQEPKTHIFLKPCGCLACAIVNVPRNFKELAKAQTYARNHGETYQLMETAAVREMQWRCPEHKKQKEVS
jgi:hypothetical protein